MRQPNLYIIAGCNGAGKTTAAFTLFPDIIQSYEFVNADEIAKKLRQKNPKSTDIESGREMLNRISFLLKKKRSFAIETTLASRSLRDIIIRSHIEGYRTKLIFFWLESYGLAIERVILRVKQGGHYIPPPIIKRRYYAGLRNLFDIYIPIVNSWMLYDNTKSSTKLVAEGSARKGINIENSITFEKVINIYRNGQRS